MASFDVHSPDFYARLDVAPGATAREVKIAYAGAVRAYPPERFPEEFKRIREAFETLSDPQARAQYDATSDPATKGLVEQGQSALEEGDYELAVRLFKRVLAIQPNAHFARNLLGQAQLRASDHEGALDQFRRLTEAVPNSSAYWTQRGTVELALGLAENAETSFRRALEIRHEDSDANLGLADALSEQARYLEAEQHLEDAIRADGVIDFDDISYFFQLIKIRVLERDPKGISEVADRIQGVLTEEWQRQRVAYRFARLAHELVELQAFRYALALAEKSERLAPGDKDIHDFARYIRENSDLLDQWEELQNDPALRDSFKYVLAVILQSYFGQWDSEADKQQAVATAYEVLTADTVTVVAEGGRPRSLADELRHVIKRYGAVARQVPPDLKRLILQGGQVATQVQVTCPHCGHTGRASYEIARYECPECNRTFDYDPAMEQAVKWSGKVEAKRTGQQAVGCVGQAVAWAVVIGLFSLIGQCA